MTAQGLEERLQGVVAGVSDGLRVRDHALRVLVHDPVVRRYLATAQPAALEEARLAICSDGEHVRVPNVGSVSEGFEGSAWCASCGRLLSDDGNRRDDLLARMWDIR